MGEVAAGEEDMELEEKMQDENEKDDDLFYMQDEHGKKQLIEIDNIKETNEKCHKTT
jgi:hypothetical protein